MCNCVKDIVLCVYVCVCKREGEKRRCVSVYMCVYVWNNMEYWIINELTSKIMLPKLMKLIFFCYQRRGNKN
jgi:hypothetical protein